MIPRSLSSAATLFVCALLLVPQLAVGAPHHHGHHRHLPQGVPQQATDHHPGAPSSSPSPVVVSEPEDTAASPSMHIQGTGRRVVGYYTNWAQYRADPYKFFPENMDGTLFTHAIFAFAKVTPSFDVVPYEWNDVLDNGQGMYARFNAVLRKANPAIKTLISLGGWNFSTDEATKGIFPSAAASESSRKTFAINVAKFCRMHGFDGVDVDWEYPTEADRDNHALLMQALRDEFAAGGKKERLLLTAAVWANHNKVAGCYDMKKLASTVDFINLMTYDLYGSWDDVTGTHTALHLPASYDGTKFSVSRGVQAWLDGGIPASQLVLGMATYGRSFTLQGPSTPSLGAATVKPAPSGAFTKEAGFLAYYEVLKMQSEGMTCTGNTDTSTMVGTKDSLWVGYDNEATLKVKVDYLTALGLSGAMFWAVDLDDFRNGSPLIRSVAKQLL